jgi:hypothetical protein
LLSKKKGYFLDYFFRIELNECEQKMLGEGENNGEMNDDAMKRKIGSSQM